MLALVRGQLARTERDIARAHLDRCAPCRDALVAIARASLTGPTGPIEPPDVDDRYMVLEPLGRGGMGVVHRVRSRDGGPSLALKSVRAPPNSDARKRFLQESQVATTISHPNVVRVFDTGETPNGVLFIVMELLDGSDLRARLARQGPLGEAEVVRIGRSVAEGLGALHDAGYVHRDVKPGNVFLCANGAIKVLDFGLAVRVSARSERLTVTDGIVGTPAYMAVEQAKGLSDEDAQTDVWGLGATLYHALAGRVPFDAPSSIEQLFRIVAEPPDPLPGEVSAWLAQLVIDCLAKPRAQRPVSMRAMVGRLDLGAAAGVADEPAVTAPMRAPRARSTRSPSMTGSSTTRESRIVSVLLAEGVTDQTVFAAEVARHDGEATPLVGGRAIGVFGATRWSGDEPLRAVRAALAIRTLGAARSLGVGTGRAMREVGRPVDGAAVVGARAALSIAHVGLDDATVDRVKAEIRIEGGRAVGELVHDPSSAPQSEVRLLCGREREIAQLETIAREALDGSEAHGVLVLGPPGIGKSRLVGAVRDRIEEWREPVRWLEARGESHRTAVPWHAIAGALRRLLALPEGTPIDEAQAVLRRAFTTHLGAELVGDLVGVTFPSTPELASLREHPPTFHHAVASALCAELATWAKDALVAIVVEDAHWIDSASAEVLDLAMRTLARAPLFVLATAREDTPNVPPEVDRHELRRLPAKAIREIVDSVLASGAPEHVELVLARADGNPYFAVELARALAEGARDTPISVEAAIQARVDALPLEERDLLRHAAIIGEHFWQEALGPSRDVAERLASLRRRDLVIPEAQTRLAGTAEWRFRHALVREFVLASIPDELRAPLHGALARWLAARPDAPAGEVARHFDQAGERDHALPFWVSVAESVAREGHFHAMLEATARVLERVPSGLVAFQMRKIRLETFMLHLARFGDAEGRELELFAATAQTPAQRGTVERFRFRLLEVCGKYEEALAATEHSLALHPEDPMLMSNMALALAWLGRSGEARAASEAAERAQERSGDPSTFAPIANGACSVAQLARRYTDALEIAERAKAGPAGDSRFAPLASANRAACLFALGMSDATARAIERTIVEAHQHHLRILQAHGLALRSMLLAYQGDALGALASASESMVVAPSSPRNLRESHLAVADALGMLGRTEQALEHLAYPGLDAAPLQRAMREAVRARVLLAAGRRDEARSAAERGLRERRAAKVMLRYELELFGAAVEAGVEGAAEEGAELIHSTAAAIRDPAQRAAFLARAPNPRLLAAAAARTS